MKKIDKVAKDVLKIIKRKEYAKAQRAAEKGTKLYTPEQCEYLLAFKSDVTNENGCEIIVTNETTQVAAHRLVVKENVDNLVLLNFASGKHAGGGFLRGSKAQEEDLCRCSGLYNCLANSENYYDYNVENKTPLYSDHTMYSPDVPWFRKSSKDKPGKMFLSSVITSPAPNAREYLRQNKDGQAELEEIVRHRAEIILAIAHHHQHRNLLLGAWGCGVFANDPVFVANVFYELLKGSFAKVFDNVTFAIYCASESDELVLKAFQERFTI